MAGRDIIASCLLMPPQLMATQLSAASNFQLPELIPRSCPPPLPQPNQHTTTLLKNAGLTIDLLL